MSARIPARLKNALVLNFTLITLNLFNKMVTSDDSHHANHNREILALMEIDDRQHTRSIVAKLATS